MIWIFFFLILEIWTCLCEEHYFLKIKNVWINSYQPIILMHIYLPCNKIRKEKVLKGIIYHLICWLLWSVTINVRHIKYIFLKSFVSDVSNTTYLFHISLTKFLVWVMLSNYKSSLKRKRKKTMSHKTLDTNHF